MVRRSPHFSRTAGGRHVPAAASEKSPGATCSSGDLDAVALPGIYFALVLRLLFPVGLQYEKPAASRIGT